jgi:hypothetical protein
MSNSASHPKVIKSKPIAPSNKKKERKNKTVRMELVVDEDEAKIIDGNAEKMYLKRSEYLRARGLKRVYTAVSKLPEADYITLAKNLQELKAQGNNLNQIARGINTSLLKNGSLELDVAGLKTAIASNIAATQAIIKALS